jgi:hypothetical protein
MGRTDSERAAIAERFQTALALFELGERMLRQRLRRRHPKASDAQIDESVEAWLRHRPGAEDGDAEGRSVPWPRARS